MAASFDKNELIQDLESKYELGQRGNRKYLSLSKMTGKMTWILIFIILILAGIIMFFASTMFNLKNGDCNTESANFAPTQVITSGPQKTVSINVKIQSCGGIKDVDMNNTTQMKFRHVFNNNNEGISCTWIIKSDAEMLNLQWSNTGNLTFPQDELLIGELSLADEGLHCRSIKFQFDRFTNVVTTPAILHFKSSSYPTVLKFECKLVPVTSRGIHKSQPQTDYVNIKPAGSLSYRIVRPDSLLGMVSVFENNEKRELICSDLKEDPVKCCDSVEVYNIDSTIGSTSCTKVSLSNLAMQMSSYRAVVLLAPTYSFCQFSWKEAKIGLGLQMPLNVTFMFG